ncbi:MAG: GDP-mannose 4,6-dehydratase [Thermoplasmatales archaeon]
MHKLFMSSGILFNHESQVRGPEFETRKMSKHVARVSNGLNEPLLLGNLNEVKDWGYAKDYVEGMWLMLQQDTPDDFVMGTGESHTVREFAKLAFKEIGIEMEWVRSRTNEVGISEGKAFVKVAKEFYRPLESNNYCADYRKTKKELGWYPKTTFR